jgi:hypothetical protein
MALHSASIVLALTVNLLSSALDNKLSINLKPLKINALILFYYLLLNEYIFPDPKSLEFLSHPAR